ncbi:MAG: hypothetical protein KF754_13770 [Planctomycetes bacterium]|nr:hypothetical protein [Planctomycetota bacterium]
MRHRPLPLVALAGLAVATLLVARAPVAAQDDAQPSATLAFELAQLAETWVHGDDRQAAARLETFAQDNRLRGELPRWLAALRAGLALHNGDTKAAMAALQPELDAADNPRPYLRAARMMTGLGYGKEALAVVRQGRARDPKSPALARFEAGLLWLEGDFEAAVSAYAGIIAADAREAYPYVPPEFGDWANVRPWGGPDKPPPEVDKRRVIRDEWDDWDSPKAATDWGREPFADLFEPATWFSTDLPGLERCIAEIATNPTELARQRAALTARLQAARESQAALEAYRGDDAGLRQNLAAKARRERALAVIAARAGIQADLAATRVADAEVLVNMAQEVAPDDIALLDLQAQVMARQGKAEQARTGPLARLASHGLVLYPGLLYARGPQQQAVHRALEPALTLYKTNAQAGEQQFEAIRTAFGPEHLKRNVAPDLLGVWLYQRGEKALAMRYLADAGRMSGFESGKSLAPDGVVLEYALLALRAPVGAAPERKAEGDDPEGKAEPEPEPEPGEAKPGNAPDSSDPLPLRVLPRAGLLLGSIPDARSVVWRVAAVDFWGGNWGTQNHLRAAQSLPDGDKQLRELLYGYHVRLATELTEAQLDAALAEDHSASKALAEAMKSFADGLQQAKGGGNWRITQTLRERAGFLLGMVESRALLVRARLRHNPPKNMAELAVWLKARQSLIDLRAQLKASGNEITDKLAQERAAAKVPEVVHSGLLLDCAKLLARNGDWAGAAQLLWLNRDVPMGIDSRGRRLFLAALFARKAGDLLTEARCRMAALEEDDPNRSSMDVSLLLMEFAQIRGEIEEFGTRTDLEAYVENSIIPWADSRAISSVFQTAPELRASRATLLMRNSLRAGMDGIFRNALAEGSISTIDRNWIKMISPRESHLKCMRFALWVLACDLPANRGRGFNSGLNSATDTIHGWGMLLQLHESRAVYDPTTKPKAERLKAIIARCSTPSEDVEEDDEDWWD